MNRGRQNTINLKHQRAFTLVELMIASFLGLIVIGGMFSMFTVNNKMIRVQDQVGSAQEKALFALELIADDIRLAGWPGVFDPSGTDPFGSPFQADYPEYEDTGGRYDVLVLSRRGRTADPDSPDPLLQQNETDCVGNEIDFETINTPLTHRYFVDPDTQELMCESSISGETETIISNVVGFQVLYGVDMVAGPCNNPLVDISAKDALAECMTPTVFVPGDQLQATLEQAMINHGSDAFTQLIPVKAIRLGIVVATEETRIVDPAVSQAREFFLFEQHFKHGENGLDFSEGRVNRHAIRTVTLRQAFRGP